MGCTCWVGVPIIPHITNFLDYHFGAAQKQFGNQSPTYTDLLPQAAQIADPAEAKPLYEKINNAIRDYVPMVPVAHGGNAAAYRADVTDPQASPLTTELFAHSAPGDRDVFVWMQNAEPISLFCAGRDRWRVPAWLRAGDGSALRLQDQ